MIGTAYHATHPFDIKNLDSSRRVTKTNCDEADTCFTQGHVLSETPFQSQGGGRKSSRYRQSIPRRVGMERKQIVPR